MAIGTTIIHYILFTAAIAGFCLGLPAVFPNNILFIDKFWVVFAFMAGITGIALIVSLLGIQKKPEVGVMSILGSIVIKLLFTMAFVLIYVIKTPVSSRLFLFNFFSLYFLFSGFEIYCLLRNLRHSIKK